VIDYTGGMGTPHSEEEKWVFTWVLDEAFYGLDPERICHAGPVPSLTPLPFQPSPAFRGAVLIQGQLTPLFCLKRLLDLPVDVEAKRLFALEWKEERFAFAVDEVVGRVQHTEEELLTERVLITLAREAVRDTL